MYNTIPNVKIEDVPLSSETRYGYNNKICAIGCFSKKDNGINVCKSVDEAKELYGDNDEYSDKYLDMLFSRNNEVLIYNTNYNKSGTLPKTISVEDMAKVQEDLSYDKFDILLPLINIPLKVDSNINPLIVSLQTIHDDYYNNKDKPFGIIGGFDLTGATLQDLIRFKELFKEHGIYKAVVTPLSVDGEDYDVCMSAVYNTIVTINKPVNESETMMIYDNNVDGKVTSEVITGLSIQNLIDNGFHTVQYFDRGAKTLQCISNITPNEYDMRIERSFNYIISRINFGKVLGMDNNRISYDVLDSIIKYEKTTAIKSGLCTDMYYDIVRTGVDEVTIKLTIVFNDIIRTIQANVNIIVE